MKAAAAIVLGAGPEEAAARAAEEALGALRGEAPSLAVLFVTPHYSARTEALLAAVWSVVRVAAPSGLLRSPFSGGT
jgi:small ligand-binding sensory domain FIST